MVFTENQAIYLQIADRMIESVLAGAWKPGDRILSIRELAEIIEVNPNTVARTYAYLADRGIISSQRGTGYVLTEGALEAATEMKRTSFVTQDLPYAFRTMDLLRMELDDLRVYYAEHRAKAGKESAS
jgi:DNA-binding transcriptional regulator YhcF (GntR family)